MSNSRLRKSSVWVVSGSSGSGKTTLCQAMLKDRTLKKKLVRSVSYTTRVLRAGEKEGYDYHHVAKEEFLALKKSGAFLESEKIFGTYYGTPKDILEKAEAKGKDLLLCIDVKGAASVKKFFKGQASLIFIATPDKKTLIDRLKKRCTESKREIEKRLKRVKMETACIKGYDHIIINDDFQKAKKELRQILMSLH